MTLIEKMRGKNIGDRTQPPALTNGQARPMHPKAAEALSEWNTALDELAYFKDRAAHLENEQKLNIERIHDLETELTHARNRGDWYCRHDAFMDATLEDVLALIVARRKQARAEAYAPPGTGAADHSAQGDDLAEGVADLAKTFAPEAGNAP